MALFVYFDASALIKRYTKEAGTDVVNELFRLLPTSRMTCSVLGILEVVSILTRKRNDRRLDQRLFEQAVLEFQIESANTAVFSPISVDDNLLYASLNLIGKHNLNASDAVILRSALDFQQTLRAANDSLLLWTSDKRLIHAAQQEGLAVFDPEQQTLIQLHQVFGH